MPPRHLFQPFWVAFLAQSRARDMQAQEPEVGPNLPPAAVFVLGANGFSAALNGEYIRSTGGHNGRPWYRKRDGSMHLFYEARQREWQLARRPGRGLFASCRGQDASDPTQLRSRWLVGAASGSDVRVEASPVPGMLRVRGEAAVSGGLDGAYCLLPFRQQSIAGACNATTGSSHAVEYRRAGLSGCSAGSLGAASGPVSEDGGGSGAAAKGTAAKPGTDVRLAFLGGVWVFAKWPSMSAGSSSRAPQCQVVASCPEQLLRPDRLSETCFGGGLVVAGVCPEAVPVAVEVGGPVQGAAGRVRGEYHRGADFDGRPSFAKPDGSMFLFYSNHLGGWQLSGMLGQGAGIWHPDVRICSPDQLWGPWQAVEEKHGKVQFLHLAIKEHPLPVRMTFLGWPPALWQLVGDYVPLAGLPGGRPAYFRGGSWHSPNTTAVSVVYDEAVGEWTVAHGGRKLAAAYAPDAHRPDRAREWHLLGTGRCVPAPSLRALVVRPGPGALLVSGRGGRISAAVNGVYARTPYDHHGRASYAKPDGSKHLFFSQRHAEWQIAGAPGDPDGVLAFCPDVHARDPSQLSRPWVVGVAEDRAVEVQPALLADVLQVRSTGGALLEGEFRLVGQLHQRPFYRFIRGALQSTVLAEKGPPLLLFSAVEGVWALAAPPPGEGHVLVHARGESAGAYRAEDVSALWRIILGPQQGRDIEVWINPVTGGSKKVHVKARAGASPVADGVYMRTEDFDSRPAYKRSSGRGEALRLLYSNVHGDWRIVGGPSTAVSRAIAFCADVRAMRPELVEGPWYISDGTSQPVEGSLAITSQCMSEWGFPIATLVWRAALLLALRIV